MAQTIDRRRFVGVALLATASGLAGGKLAAGALGSDTGEARVATILWRHFRVSTARRDVVSEIYLSLLTGERHTEDAAYFRDVLSDPRRSDDLERYVIQEFVVSRAYLSSPAGATDPLLTG